MREKNEIKVAVFFLVIVAIFGNTAIEIIGKAKCFAIANLVGEIFAPLFGIGAIIFCLYLLWYITWHVPRKIFCRLFKPTE